MPYRFLEEEATADVAFEAWGKDLAGVFRDAADAVINVMIDNIHAVEPRETRPFEIENRQLDLLLFNALEQLVYYKDAQQLLLRLNGVSVSRHGERWRVHAVGAGERLDLTRHHQHVDVKAITLHDFSLKQTDGEWRAHVILDI